MECFFWDFEKEIWSPTKCQLIPHDSNRINTVCKCYNATNFAALVDRKDRIDIELMTSLSCGLSTISLLSTLILILSKTLNNNQSINRRFGIILSYLEKVHFEKNAIEVWPFS
jgi:hypothetical protein